MARTPAEQTPSTPYIASWTAASQDLTSTAANAPIALGGALCGVDGRVFAPILACNDAAGVCTAFLCVLDRSARYGSKVIWAQETVYTAGSRRQAPDGASGLYIMAPSATYWAFDLRGVPTNPTREVFFGIASITTATQVVLVEQFFPIIT